MFHCAHLTTLLQSSVWSQSFPCRQSSLSPAFAIKPDRTRPEYATPAKRNKGRIIHKIQSLGLPNLFVQAAVNLLQPRQQMGRPLASDFKTRWVSTGHPSTSSCDFTGPDITGLSAASCAASCTATRRKARDVQTGLQTHSHHGTARVSLWPVRFVLHSELSR